MSKVNYVIVFSSANYRDLIYTCLNKNSMIFIEPVKEEEKLLSEYVKKNTVEISNYDALVIDLGVLKDTDEQIIEALEAIRFYDDKLRIIILEGNRSGGHENLFNQCFLNGIYDLIETDDFITTRSSLEKCLLEGMSYKDALEFKNGSARKKKKEEEKNAEFHRKTIAFLGAQARIGTTHCALVTAYTLRKRGYLVAVVDCTGSRDYLELMKTYEQHLSEEDSFTVDEIDFYIKRSSGEGINFEKHLYNFVIYDFGAYIHEEEQEIYVKADEKVLVTGSKPWELSIFSDTLRNFGPELTEINYLFNFTSPALETDLKKMMIAAGIEKNVYVMEYLDDFFSESEVIQKMLQIIPQKNKKKWFKRH